MDTRKRRTETDTRKRRAASSGTDSPSLAPAQRHAETDSRCDVEARRRLGMFKTEAEQRLFLAARQKNEEEKEAEWERR